MQSGFATAEATAMYAARFPSHQRNSFYRQALGLTISSLGIGTYLGEMDEATDAAYQNAVETAVRSGINFIDTSLNYRHQRSERNIGAALEALGDLRRELVICTKAGFLVPSAVPPAGLSVNDVAGRMHCMAPSFLEDQLGRSLENLRLETIDVFYVHNPETQLRFVKPEIFARRMEAAFAKLEEMTARSRIRYYGTATWDGYRRNGAADGLSLVRLADIAHRIAGDHHHFRFIQLPFNLAMTEAYGQRAEALNGDRISVLEASQKLGITAIASASLMQAKLASGLPEALVSALAGLETDAGRAIQFTRSAPGIVVALAGMSNNEHVGANLEVAGCPPLAPERFAELLSS